MNKWLSLKASRIRKLCRTEEELRKKLNHLECLHTMIRYELLKTKAAAAVLLEQYESSKIDTDDFVQKLIAVYTTATDQSLEVLGELNKEEKK